MTKMIDVLGSGVRGKLVNRKPKSVILSKGSQVVGRTNATNPTSLSKLQSAYAAKVMASMTPLPTKTSAPVKRLPPIDKQYEDMGAALGICPYELRDIMLAEISEDQTLIFTLLKKFVGAVKLSGAVDFSSTHKQLRVAEDGYKAQMDRWHQQCKEVDRQAAAIQREIDAKEKTFYAAWSEILIDLQTKLNTNNDITSLGEWDRLMTMAIAAQGDEYCRMEGNCAILDFKKCQKMNADTISDLPRLAGEIKEEEEQAQWQHWISRATVNQLLKRLWEMGLDTDDEVEAARREQLEWTIIAKSGKTPVRDRWGNLNWHATFNQESDDDSLDDFDLTLDNKTPRRVKSGSGRIR